MKRFWTDRIAIITALVGIILMALTLHWHVNPVEGSVVPRFLTGNPVGVGVLWILLVTCMPVWIIVVSSCTLFPLPACPPWLVPCGAMLVLQGAVYFMIGKLISVCIKKMKRRKASSNISVEAHDAGAP